MPTQPTAAVAEKLCACSTHAGNALLPASEFYRNSARPSGLSDYCKACVKAAREQRATRLVAEPAAAARDAVADVSLFADMTFGVEVEVAVKDGAAGSEQDVNAAVTRVVAAALREAGVSIASTANGAVDCADGRRWSIVRDGSIYPAGAEVVSPILKMADVPALQTVVRGLRRAGFVANNSCGLHVHVGTAGMTPQQLGGLATVVYEQQDVIFHALRVRPARAQQYCKPLPHATVERLSHSRTPESLSTAWYGHRAARPSKYDASRYYAVNFNSHFFRGTVEYRYFNGTLHAGKIKAAVQLALALTAYAKVGGRGAIDAPVLATRAGMAALLDRVGLLAGEEFTTARHHLLAVWDEGDDESATNATN